MPEENYGGERVPNNASVPREDYEELNGEMQDRGRGDAEPTQVENWDVRGMAEQQRRVGTSVSRESPVSVRILSKALPVGFKVPSLPDFDGTRDPHDHLEQFSVKMGLYNVSNAVTCRVFRTTLTKKAHTWLSQLAPGSIIDSEHLSAKFLRHFISNKRCPKTANHLFTMVQGERKSLRDYVRRFTNEVLEVPQVNEELLSSIILRGLRRGRFKSSIAGKSPTTLNELLTRAEKYIKIEEIIGEEAGPSMKRKGREEAGGRQKRCRDE